MVLHEDIGVHSDGIDIERLSEYLEKAAAIRVIFEDCLSFISTTGYVIDRVGV